MWLRWDALVTAHPLYSESMMNKIRPLLIKPINSDAGHAIKIDNYTNPIDIISLCYILNIYTIKWLHIIEE